MNVLHAVEARVVGLRREAEVLSVALDRGCHVVLDGPPGTGKSTLLRALAAASGRGVQFVEGNAELTPARLIGQHDPALVLNGGYTPEAWSDGPLATAMRAGELLYLEELNRIPEETLNVLICAMAERELVVPRVGRIAAADGFMLVAAMNPFDAVGTARVGQAISDRMCRVSVGYLDSAQEREVVRRQTGLDGAVAAVAVSVARGTRRHEAVRMGSSVRGAIDMVQLADGLASLRGGDPTERQTLLDAALAAMSGRIAVHEDQDRSAEGVIAELLDAVLASGDGDRATRPDGGGGDAAPDRAQATASGLPRQPRRANGEALGADETRARIDAAGRRTISRERLAATHEQFATVSPGVGRVEVRALAETLRREPERAVAMLADMACATDPALRAASRRLARRLFPPLGRLETPTRRGTRRLVSVAGALDGELDVERTLDRSGGLRPREPRQLVTRRFAAAPRAVCLLVDRSGSMTGRAVALAAVAAAAIVQAASDRLRCGVIAFAAEPMLLHGLGDSGDRHGGGAVIAGHVVEDLLALRGHGTTDIARALQVAGAQLAQVPPGGRTAILLSDCLHTVGDDPLGCAGALDRLHVLATCVDPDALRAGRALARRGRGRWLPATTLGELTRNLGLVLV